MKGHIMKFKSFGRQLDAAIANGEDLSAQLEDCVEEAMGLHSGEYQTKKNTYIQSFPGAGKTFTAEKICKKNKLDPIIFRGATTMYAFAMRLCYEAYWNPAEQIPIIIDDCDALFTGEEHLNIMKDFFDVTNTFSWAKGVSETMAGVKGNEKMVEAIQAAKAPGVGMQFSTEKFSTLVLSNRVLTSTTDLKTKRVRTTKQTIGEAAIRSRVQYVSTFSNLTDDENWGWLAYIVLNSSHFEDIKKNKFTLTVEQKQELLTWMHYNWSGISDPSMRTVGELAGKMKRDPEGYINKWNLMLG